MMPVETGAGAYVVNLGAVGVVGTLFGMPIEALILGSMAGAVAQGLNPSGSRTKGISTVLVSMLLAGAFSPVKWDIVEIEGDTERVRAWFEGQAGKKYDYLAWLGFLWRRESGSRNRWFCSEAVATALGYADGWRFDPNTLFVVLKGGEYE